MKILVTYHSLSGNTKKVADAIFKEISTEKELKPFTDVESLDPYDFSFIGFPVHQFGPAQAAKDFLKSKASGKKIALFTTHASPKGESMLDGLLNKCQEAAAGSELIGFFDCRGELAEGIANALLKAPDPKFQEFGRQRSETIGHPDKEELALSQKFAREMLGKI